MANGELPGIVAACSDARLRKRRYVLAGEKTKSLSSAPWRTEYVHPIQVCRCVQRICSVGAIDVLGGRISRCSSAGSASIRCIRKHIFPIRNLRNSGSRCTGVGQLLKICCRREIVAAAFGIYQVQRYSEVYRLQQPPPQTSNVRRFNGESTKQFSLHGEVERVE